MISDPEYQSEESIGITLSEERDLYSLYTCW